MCVAQKELCSALAVWKEIRLPLNMRSCPALTLGDRAALDGFGRCGRKVGCAMVDLSLTS